MNAAQRLIVSYYPDFLRPPIPVSIPKRHKLGNAGGLKVVFGRLEARGFPPKLSGAKGLRP